jgi:ABC-2 type transport system ATP-binding protein
MGRPVVEVEGLVKQYGGVPALRGVDLTVEEGSVLALIGANGAGKTTLVRILTTLLKPDAGRAVVAGWDVLDSADRVRSSIGLTGQYAALDERLTGRENLDLIGRLYHLGKQERRSRTEELLSRLSLDDAADRRVSTYSGGMRRRLDVAAGLVGRTPVVVLDEPTTGLDPRTRNALWALIRDRSEQGATVLMTTQYLEEADRLADRIVLIEKGCVVAAGTPDQLKDLVGGSVLEARVRPADIERAAALLEDLEHRRPIVDPEEQRITIASVSPETLPTAFERLAEARVEVIELGVRRPSLDEVFLALTDPARGGRASWQSPPALRDASVRRRSRHRGRHGKVPPRHTSADIWAMTTRNLRRIRRSPQTLALSLGQPILLLLGFRYLLGGAINVSDSDYVQYLLPGLFTAAVIIASGGTAISLTQDLQSGVLDRFRSLPIVRSAVLAGRTTADQAVNLVALAAIIALGIPLGFEFRGSAGDIAKAIALLVLLGYALTWMYAAIGMALKSPEASYAAGTVTLFLLLFSSSAFVPIGTMPDWLQAIARVQPVTVTINAVRALTNGLPAHGWPWQSLAWSTAILLVSAGFAVLRYRDIAR